MGIHCGDAGEGGTDMVASIEGDEGMNDEQEPRSQQNLFTGDQLKAGGYKVNHEGGINFWHT